VDGSVHQRAPAEVHRSWGGWLWFLPPLPHPHPCMLLLAVSVSKATGEDGTKPQISSRPSDDTTRGARLQEGHEEIHSQYRTITSHWPLPVCFEPRALAGPSLPRLSTPGPKVPSGIFF
jgi:hypothetical protein